MNPKISVVTPCFNGQPYIEEAIESVEKQSYDNYEHIVVDGGSTDGTLDVLRSADVEFISEDDDGLYDALNKGIEMADGDFVTWLNADDVLAPEAFEATVSEYRKNPSAEFIAGDSEMFRDEVGKRVTVKTYDFTQPSDFEQGHITHRGSAICGCLFASSLLDSIGLFDQTFDIASDIEYLFRVASDSPDCEKTDQTIYRYRAHEGSLTFSDSEFGPVTRKGSLEMVAFLPRYIQSTDLPPPLRSTCLQRFRVRAAMLLHSYVINGDVSAAVRCLYRVLSVDKTWPLWAARTVVSKYILDAA